MKISGVPDALARLNRLSAHVRREAAKALHAEGDAIKTRSQALAPVDEGNLEEAHAVDTVTKPSRVTTTISVGGIVDGVDVGDYVGFTHEGDYNLGPLSRAKAQASGQPVGPKYLERALDERKDMIADSVAEAVRKALA
jgi:hypothetical protein